MCCRVRAGSRAIHSDVMAKVMCVCVCLRWVLPDKFHSPEHFRNVAIYACMAVFLCFVILVYGGHI